MNFILLVVFSNKKRYFIPRFGNYLVHPRKRGGALNLIGNISRANAYSHLLKCICGEKKYPLLKKKSQYRYLKSKKERKLTSIENYYNIF